MLDYLNKDLRYGSTLHTNVLQALNARKKFSANKLSDRHEQWILDEEAAKAYINLKEKDRLRKEERKVGESRYVTLEIPYSYALLMAAHTYWATVFLGRNPVLQYAERHGLTSGGSEGVEAIMNYQVNVGKMLVPFMYWLLDTPKYGVGWVGHHWEKEMRTVSAIMEEPVEFAGFAINGKSRKVKKTIQVPGYVGNKVFNIRPQDAWPDPRVSLANFQRGEFFARYLEIPWHDLHTGALDKRYINVDVVKKLNSSRSNDPDRNMGSGNYPIPGADNTSLFTDLGIPETGFVKGYEEHVRLIPKQWKLGKGERPELWVFTVAMDDVIIEARPLGELHDEFPFSNMEYEIDAHAMFKRSMPETLAPLNSALSWLINSHFYAVRKSLNNQFIYDPTKMRGDDFTDPQHGLLVRLRPNAFGQPIGNFFAQIPTNDLTRNHINDAKVLTDFMQRVAGVNDIIMGMMQQGGRQTATEVRGASGFSMSRLRTQAEFMSAMGFGPLSQRMLQSTQQHLDVERAYRLAGDLLPGGAGELMLGPEQIAGFYDYTPVDGTMPVDRFAQASLWKEFLMQLNQVPQVASQYDFGKIFAYVMQLAGAKNVQKFRINVVPDAQLAGQAQAGNVVPLQSPRGGAYARGNPAGVEATANRLNSPAQIPGLGPVS